MKKSRTSKLSRPMAETKTILNMDVDSPAWQLAKACTEDLNAIIVSGSTSAANVASLAARWSVSQSTVWRRIRRFRESGNLTGLIPGHVGRKPGVLRLDPAVEVAIQTAARQWWQRTENATVAEIEPTVVRFCLDGSIKAPSRATIARRLAKLRKDPKSFAGEVRMVVQERRRLMKSSYEVAQPLDVVQVDHTVADVFIVDPASRLCIGRPTLTMAIDIATRCVLGHCLSLEAPSALLVALCLEQAVFPKNEWLAGLGLDLQYPMHGLPKALHSDNGSEFHAAAFRRGCDLNNIETIYRPPGTPRFGGHIERLIGTFMRRIRLLPGNSYSEILKRRQRAAESNACLTLRDVHRYLGEEIVRYHNRIHRGIGMSPRQAWEIGLSKLPKVDTPRVPSDRLGFRVTFLPVRHRTVGREGIELFGLKYSAPELASHVDPGVKRVVRFDPRDLSHVYLEALPGGHIQIPLRDQRLPPFSLWEWQSLRQKQRQLVERADADALRLESLRMESVFAPTARTPMQGRRRAARKTEWRAVQQLQELSGPNLTLEASLTAPADGAQLAWEILE